MFKMFKEIKGRKKTRMNRMLSKKAGKIWKGTR